MTDVLVVLCTFPDEEKARHIGALMVEKQVAACVNIVPGLRSIYRWKGEIHDDSEVLGIMKTTSEQFPVLKQALQEAHPYENPEILALPVADGLESYLHWVAEEAKPSR